MTRNVSVCWVTGLATLACVLLIGAGPSRPVPSVSYSSDAESWTRTLSDPLFDNDIRWVPGDRRSTELHVSNDTDDDGRLVLFVESRNPALREMLTLSVEGGDQAVRCTHISVPAHETLLVETTLELNVEASNETQSATAGIDLLVQWDKEDDDVCVGWALRNLVDGQEEAQP
ncbi:hypothetical protein BJD99_17805 [Rhodococcus sp. 1163]|uniref:hypothetical protein n=1 Tax=unclassified Rhodococcus (in: high G+C Gram-positive bacteria) TaxID=192944 RepID=UPI000A069529|nr:hypothetical protein [Rhodococcus sp. 1163]ORI18647.1 hypothetical protein BJD99_17805 [Rhodococcus sp. 1163]